jgi:hypothetical protein
LAAQAASARVVLAAMMILAVNYAARAEECDALIPIIVSMSGATVQRKTELGHYHLRHPLSTSLVVSCLPWQSDISISAAYEGASPPDAYFELVSKIGAVLTGDSVALIRAGATRCHQLALRSTSELANVNTGNAAIECHSFTRDGGATLVSVFRK